MVSGISLNAPAKINWMLRVFDRRPDGYHDIETIFQTISLHDTLTLRPAARFSFRCDDRTVPNDEANLVVRTVRLMTEAFDLAPVEVELSKRIPAGGGLGGGSSDAATVIRGLLELFGIETTRDRIAEAALSLGSDIPFFLMGGVAYATGRGEKLTALHSREDIPLLLALPRERVSTAEAYALLEKTRRPLKRAAIGLERARRMVDEGLLKHAGELTNDFEEVVFARIASIGELKRTMLEQGAAWSGMSGSGSTIIGAFHDQQTRDRAAKVLEKSVTIVAAETS